MTQEVKWLSAGFLPDQQELGINWKLGGSGEGARLSAKHRGQTHGPSGRTFLHWGADYTGQPTTVPILPFACSEAFPEPPVLFKRGTAAGRNQVLPWRTSALTGW